MTTLIREIITLPVKALPVSTDVLALQEAGGGPGSVKQVTMAVLGVSTAAIAVDGSQTIDDPATAPLPSNYVSGDIGQISKSVTGAGVISIGDLLFETSGIPKRANDQADQTTLALNQELFHDTFLGIALTAKLTGEDPKTVEIATRGIWEFDAPTAAEATGDLFGINEADSGTALFNQMIITVATANLSIGRLVSQVTTRSKIAILSSLVWSGHQDIA